MRQDTGIAVDELVASDVYPGASVRLHGYAFVVSGVKIGLTWGPVGLNHGSVIVPATELA